MREKEGKTEERKGSEKRKGCYNFYV